MPETIVTILIGLLTVMQAIKNDIRKDLELQKRYEVIVREIEKDPIGARIEIQRLNRDL